jgi:hypothetical protein
LPAIMPALWSPLICLSTHPTTVLKKLTSSQRHDSALQLRFVTALRRAASVTTLSTAPPSPSRLYSAGQHLHHAQARQLVFLPLHCASRPPQPSPAHGPTAAFSTGPAAAFSTRAASSISVNSMHRRASKLSSKLQYSVARVNCWRWETTTLVACVICASRAMQKDVLLQKNTKAYDTALFR